MGLVMKRLMLVVLLGLLMPWPPGVSATYNSGMHLKDFCDGGLPDEMDMLTGLCDGYLQGVSDSLAQLRATGVASGAPVPYGSCAPAGIAGPELRVVVLNYLARNPQNLHFNAAGLVMLAFEEAWPCPR
jgi:hypothetical protein